MSSIELQTHGRLPLVSALGDVLLGFRVSERILDEVMLSCDLLSAHV